MSKKIILSLLIIGFSLSLQAQDKLTLGKAISLGLKNSYGISISEQESEVAGLNNTWGAVGAYPTITGSAQFNFTSDVLANPIVNNNTTSASIDANWTIFNGYRVKTSKRITEGRYDLAKNSEVVQIENCISNIVLAYYYYIIEKELLDVTSKLHILSKDRYERDKNAVEIGGKSTYELIQTESAYLTDHQNMFMQERVVKNAMNNLNLAMSINPNNQWVIESEIEIPSSEYKFDVLMELMTSNNSILKAQYINQRVSDDQIKLAKGDMMPKLSLTAGGRYNFTSMADNSSFSPYAGVSLSATIFAGEVKKRNLAISKIQANITDISINQIKLEMTTSLMNQLDNYNYTRQILSLANRDLEVSEINLELSLERLNRGSMNSFDYRIVHIEYLNSAINRHQLMFNLLSSNVELARLIGGIIQEYNP